MSHTEYLLEQLKQTAGGEVSYSEFQDKFYNYYITKVGDADLVEQDHDFFTKIQEKFEYTVENPTEEDREHGYIDYEEFVTWLKEKV